MRKLGNGTCFFSCALAGTHQAYSEKGRYTESDFQRCSGKGSVLYAVDGDDDIKDSSAQVGVENVNVNRICLHGWYDVQGHGICNDYCRWTGDCGCSNESNASLAPRMYRACANQMTEMGGADDWNSSNLSNPMNATQAATIIVLRGNVLIEFGLVDGMRLETYELSESFRLSVAFGLRVNQAAVTITKIEAVSAMQRLRRLLELGRVRVVCDYEVVVNSMSDALRVVHAVVDNSAFVARFTSALESSSMVPFGSIFTVFKLLAATPLVFVNGVVVNIAGASIVVGIPNSTNESELDLNETLVVKSEEVEVVPPPPLPAAYQPLICEPGNSGLLLPFGGDDEQRWPNGLRCVLYLVGLLYCFLGVSVAADRLLKAIEIVTSMKKVVGLQNLPRMVSVKIWNGTITNLTLMAVARSAPEILLPFIEILGNDMHSGNIGPSTIVGSAGFNILCMLAVYVFVVPDGEVRHIEDSMVLMVVAGFLIFAFFWLLIILLASSEDVVDIWEAFFLLIFYPVLLTAAYCASKEYCTPKSRARSKKKVTEKELNQIQRVLSRHRGQRMNESEVTELLHHSKLEDCNVRFRSHAVRRLEAVSVLTRGKYDDLGSTSGPTTADIEMFFSSSRYEFRTDVDGFAMLDVERRGNLNWSTSVQYRTLPGSALPNEEFISRSGTIKFNAGVRKMQIKIQIISSSGPRLGMFSVELMKPELVDSPGARCAPPSVDLGSVRAANVVLVSNDNVGELRFREEYIEVSGLKASTIEIVVERCRGARGVVQCDFRTERGSARPHLDFVENVGTLDLQNGQSEATIAVQILPKSELDDVAQEDTAFHVVLEDPVGIGFVMEGEHDIHSRIMTVCVTNQKASPKDNAIVSWFDGLFSTKEQLSITVSDAWKQQLCEAWYVNGSAEEQDKASCLDFIIHWIAFPWKMLFAALVPPWQVCNGLCCFVVSLFYVCFMTVVIFDMARLFGCVADIPDSVTAITFVAMGTSIPDVLASATSAQKDPSADVLLIGIVGSSCINIFLGLGLPWFVGACYWSAEGASPAWLEKHGSYAARYPNGGFVVPARALGFNIGVLLITCIIFLGVMQIRKAAFGGELGGPYIPKVATAALFFLLWVYFIVLCIWMIVSSQSPPEPSPGDQAAAIFLGLLIVFVLMCTLLLRLREETWEKGWKDLEDPLKERQSERRPSIARARHSQRISVAMMDSHKPVNDNGGPLSDLRASASKDAHPDVMVGSPVRLKNLGYQPKLNGAQCIVQEYCGAQPHWLVQLPDGTMMPVSEKNLVPLALQAGSADSQFSDCLLEPSNSELLTESISINVEGYNQMTPNTKAAKRASLKCHDAPIPATDAGSDTSQSHPGIEGGSSPEHAGHASGPGRSSGGGLERKYSDDIEETDERFRQERPHQRFIDISFADMVDAAVSRPSVHHDSQAGTRKSKTLKKAHSKSQGVKRQTTEMSKNHEPLVSGYDRDDGQQQGQQDDHAAAADHLDERKTKRKAKAKARRNLKRRPSRDGIPELDPAKQESEEFMRGSIAGEPDPDRLSEAEEESHLPINEAQKAERSL